MDCPKQIFENSLSNLEIATNFLGNEEIRYWLAVKFCVSAASSWTCLTIRGNLFENCIFSNRYFMEYFFPDIDAKILTSFYVHTLTVLGIFKRLMRVELKHTSVSIISCVILESDVGN